MAFFLILTDNSLFVGCLRTIYSESLLKFNPCWLHLIGHKIIGCLFTDKHKFYNWFSCADIHFLKFCILSCSFRISVSLKETYLLGYTYKTNREPIGTKAGHFPLREIFCLLKKCSFR